MVWSYSPSQSHLHASAFHYALQIPCMFVWSVWCVCVCVCMWLVQVLVWHACHEPRENVSINQSTTMHEEILLLAPILPARGWWHCKTGKEKARSKIYSKLVGCDFVDCALVVYSSAINNVKTVDSIPVRRFVVKMRLPSNNVRHLQGTHLINNEAFKHSACHIYLAYKVCAHTHARLHECTCGFMRVHWFIQVRMYLLQDHAWRVHVSFFLSLSLHTHTFEVLLHNARVKRCGSPGQATPHATGSLLVLTWSWPTHSCQFAAGPREEWNMSNVGCVTLAHISNACANYLGYCSDWSTRTWPHSIVQDIGMC